MEHGNERAIYAALAANAGLAVAKFVGFAFTGAASMLAEGVHSVADTGNQALLLWGTAAASKAPSEEHPFGYGRERYFWAFVVALVIFSLGSLFAIYEGVERLLHPHALSSPGWAIGVLLVGILLEGTSFGIAVRAAREVKGEATWWQFIRRTKNPELPVVVLEDLGALLGLVLALTGVGLSVVTGDARFDALGSIAIGALLGVIAVVLAIEMKSLIIGESAEAVQLERIRASVDGIPDVVRIIHLRTQHLGPDHLLVGAKVEFDADLDFTTLTHRIDDVEARIRDVLPHEATIYIEPDVYEPAEGGDRASDGPPPG